MNIGGIDAGWLWLIGAALLAILELAAPGVFLVWLAAAAVLTGLATHAFGLDLPYQLLVFGFSAILCVLLGRRLYQRQLHVSDDPLLNDRGARLIGQSVTVVVAIENGEGRVTVGDGIWSARGPDVPAGTRVRITGTQGGCLLVTPAQALPGPDAASTI